MCGNVYSKLKCLTFEAVESTPYFRELGSHYVTAGLIQRELLNASKFAKNAFVGSISVHAEVKIINSKGFQMLPWRGSFNAENYSSNASGL